jgi:hypothetical protein
MIDEVRSNIDINQYGMPNNVADKHSCLPIWYGQESNVADKVVNEINNSIIN